MDQGHPETSCAITVASKVGISRDGAASPGRWLLTALEEEHKKRLADGNVGAPSHTSRNYGVGKQLDPGLAP
jgi:hypothetical protein